MASPEGADKPGNRLTVEMRGLLPRYPVLRPRGELDGGTVRLLRAAVAPLLAHRADVLVFDLGGVTFAGAELVEVLSADARCSHTVVLRSVARQLHVALGATRATRLFRLEA